MKLAENDAEYSLSIVIPTYGYPEDVKKNVDRLLKIERNDIEIVVVDNDESGQQVGAFMEAIDDPRFHYYRNKKNIGRSANIVKAVEMATSKNVLLHSSDDELRFEIIAVILEKIKQNPDYAVIMGKVEVRPMGLRGYRGIEHTYKAGYEALMAVPWMGCLIPFVINKRWLDFDSLYRQEETYMQIRLALMASGKGDFIGVEDVFANTCDTAHLSIDKEQQLRKIWHEKDFQTKWSIGKCYYSPEARAEQLKRDIASIEHHRSLRRSHLLHLIDKFTTANIFYALEYVVVCHSPSVVESSGTVGFVGYKEALSTFEEIMKDFFSEREKEKLYYYTGNLHDKIQNELLNIEYAGRIMDEILAAGEVFVYGSGREAKLLHDILDLMGISVGQKVEGQLALVPHNYERENETVLQAEGAAGIHFMDWMWKYLAIQWCDRHRSAEYMDSRYTYLC